jgi:hypothetical protein
MFIRVGSIFIQADGFSLDRYLACRFSLAERLRSDTNRTFRDSAVRVCSDWLGSGFIFLSNGFFYGLSPIITK